MRAGGFFRTLRISILLLVLFIVAAQTWLTHLRTTDWNETLWVAVYPINGDGSQQAAQYINKLDNQAFLPISEFLSREAKRYQLGISQPVTLKLGPVVQSLPPSPPVNGNPFEIMLWSLQLRFWAFRHDEFNGPAPDARIFVLYNDPGRHSVLNHSLGLKKGLIGVVNAYASRQYSGRNNLVITHEFLHTVGASDKYNLVTSQPVYPDGYAEPGKQPLFPQKLAEIMAGRIPLSETNALMPSSMRSLRIGSLTAQEIRWVKHGT